MLPVVPAAATEVFAPLSDADREHLIAMSTTVRARVDDLSARPPATPKPRRKPTAKAAGNRR